MESPSKYEQLLILTDVIKVLVSNTETENKYAIFEENVPPLGGPPPHSHPDEEVFYVLEGEFEFVRNDLNNPFRALPGSVVHVASNEVHTFKNVGYAPGKMIVMLTPGNLLDYFRAIGDPLKNIANYPDLKKVPDFSKLNVEKAFKHAAEHHVQFIVPKIAEN